MEVKPGTTKVFVYGTLLKGFGNNHLLNNSTFICDAIMRGLKMFDLGFYPACIVTNNPNDIIVGEVYEVTWGKLMGELDRLEGYPRYYDRIEKEFESEDFEDDAWIYIQSNYQVKGNPVIASGNWMTRST